MYLFTGHFVSIPHDTWMYGDDNHLENAPTLSQYRFDFKPDHVQMPQEPFFTCHRLWLIVLIYKCIGQTYLKISKSFLAIWTHKRRSIRIISFFWFNFFLHFMKLILWTVYFWSNLREKLVWNGGIWVWLGLSHIYSKNIHW